MGHCYTKQQTETLRTINSRKVKPQKCIYLQNPSTLILEMSKGNVENIPVKTSGEGLSFSYSVGQLYFGTKNQIFYILEVPHLNDVQFLEAVHAYYLATCDHQTNTQKQSYMIQPQCAYLMKSEQKMHFIIKSKQLAQEGVRFVDLLDLGKRLREKQIHWQDLEFGELITQFCRKYSKISKDGTQQISNIIVGSDGSVHLLCIFSQQITQSVLRQVQILQKMWLTALYGVEDINKTAWMEIEKKLQFKHPNSLDYIENLKLKIDEQKKNQYCRIANPSLKFIRDYISAYYYKLSACNPQMIDSLIALRQWGRAKEILVQYMSNISAYKNITPQSYQLYKKLLYLQNIKNKDSTETAEANARVTSAAYYLAQKQKQGNNYKQSYHYYKECLEYGKSQQDQTFYFGMAEVARAINLNKDTQSILNLGLETHPKSRILYLSLILYLCDCLRVDEAEKLLMKATPYFRTLEMEICSAKIMLTKSTLFPQYKVEYLRKSKEELSHVVLQKYMKQSNTNVKYIIPLYHQLLGDLYLQQRQFPKAKQEYHTSRILLKNDNACGFKLATITAAQANCLMMDSKLDESIIMYTQASQQASEDCSTLIDSIKGNRAIAKIKKGMHQQGKFDIQQILSKVPPETLKSDFNYIFLMNVLKNTKTTST